MVSAQLSGVASVSSGKTCNFYRSKWGFPLNHSGTFYGLCASVSATRVRIYGDGVNGGALSLDMSKGLWNSPVIRRRKSVFSKLSGELSSDSGLQSYDVEEISSVLEEQSVLLNSNGPPNDTSLVKDVRRELVMLSIPAIAGQAIEPLVQLMETAYIGRLGSVELASAGVSISLFNIISKLFNIPLLSVATSFVAEDIAKNPSRFTRSADRLQLSSVSTALLLAVSIGIIETIALFLGSGALLSLMGVPPGSSMRAPARQFLFLRAIGAPAYVVSLALQGIFRGFKDTKTPVFCLGFGNLAAVFLFPLLMYYFRLGVTGAAISTVISQYTITFSMLWHLNKRAAILPPRLGYLQFGGYLKSGGFLIGRTLSVLLAMTFATSMAARQGPVAMAAHQICIQVWLAVSLLTDALATSAQALIASYISKRDYSTVRDVAGFSLKIGFVVGASLAVILGLSFGSLAPLFTKDTEVLGIVRTGVLFVSASQPINALAFIFDGLHYGVSDFAYAARSMMVVAAISSGFLLYTTRIFGLPGVWSGLTLLMTLRTVAGVIRLLSPGGPWWFMHGDVKRTELAA